MQVPEVLSEKKMRVGCKAERVSHGKLGNPLYGWLLKTLKLKNDFVDVLEGFDKVNFEPLFEVAG